VVRPLTKLLVCLCFQVRKVFVVVLLTLEQNFQAVVVVVLAQ
jgi:hypothetical protein